MTTSTIIEPTADLLRDLAETVSVTMQNGSRNLKGYTWEPRTFDVVPAAAVGPPTVRRTGVDDGESQLGSTDWFMDFPVGLYFDLDEAAKSQGQMVEALEAFIRAVDDDPNLNQPMVMLASVTNAEPFVEDGRERTLCGYLCTVSVERLVAD